MQKTKISQIIGLVLLSILFIVGQVTAQDEVGWEVLRLVNDIRSSDNVLPLVMNPQLVSAAQIHADDMAQQQMLTHVGIDGSQFWNRISRAGYSMVDGTELVVGQTIIDAAFAVQLWSDSETHRQNIVNPNFGDVGIGYALGADGKYYFVMLLATQVPSAQPPSPVATEVGALPTPIPSATPLDITNTPFPTLIAPPTPTVFVIPTDVPPPTRTPFPTQPPLPTALPQQQASGPATLSPLQLEATRLAPTPAPPDIRLIYDDENMTLINISDTPIDISYLTFVSASGELLAVEWNSEFLTTRLTEVPSGDCLQAWVGINTNPPLTDQCAKRHGWINTDTYAQFWLNAEAFVVRNNGLPLGFCSGYFGTCELSLIPPDNLQLPQSLRSIVPERPPDIRLVYDESSFTLINAATGYLDLLGLYFVSDTGEMDVERWDTQFLAQPLFSMDPGGCVQAWRVGLSQLPKPPDCRSRKAWIPIGEPAWFWIGTTSFEVYRNDALVATCLVGDGACEFSLSEEKFDTSQQVAAFSTPVPPDPFSGQYDVRLVYDDDSFALVNSSGVPQNFAQLTFESDSGVYTASRWDNGSLGSPLASFNSGDCMQIWLVGTELQPVPDTCRRRQSWNAVAPAQQFWLATDSFRVRRDGQLLATCLVSSLVCEFDMG